MRKLLLSAMLALGLSAQAATTVQWYHQQTAATSLADGMILTIESATSNSYRHATALVLKNYILPGATSEVARVSANNTNFALTIGDGATNEVARQGGLSTNNTTKVATELTNHVTWNAQTGSAALTNLANGNASSMTNITFLVPQWIDVLGNSQPAAGSADPVLTAVTNGSLILLPGYQQADASYWTFQLPHNIATTNANFILGTATNQWHIEPHVHFLVNGNGTIDATHSNVTWQLEWQVASINGTYAAGTNTVTVGVAAKNKHYIAEFGAITNGGPYGISASFVARLSRVASGVRDLSPGATTRDVCLPDFDLHTPVGNVTMLGSRGETSQ